jgi:hypothetical protein
MASFNKPKKKSTVTAAKNVPAKVRKIATAVPDTINLAGGQAFRLTPHYEFAFALLTTFLEPEFYASPNQKIQQIRNAMIKVNDPIFCAKAAIYARTVYGMRSVSHLIAADIAKGVKGHSFTKNFFDKVVYRVDDASEILAAYMAMHKKPIPNSLKKGLALGLSKFNAYQLAKYKGTNKGVKLVDLFNLVHPKPNAENAKAYKDLIEGNLASSDTWESELSEAGQNVSSEAEKAANKKEVWADLIGNNKIGYFALLRNLRNIIEQADDDTIKKACATLVNEKLIKKSLVLPFRFMTAMVELNKLTSNSKTRMVSDAVSDAIDISVNNVPSFSGETLVVLDDSGSMGNPHTDVKSPAAIGSLFASVVAKKNNADLMLFNSAARYMNYSAKDPVATTTEKIRKLFQSGGTNFHAIFQVANKKYDRIIILSDMQGWMGHNAPTTTFGQYCAKYKANPKVYSFDLQGHGTVQFPQEHIYCLAGFSEKTLDLMKVLEEDPGALLKQIQAIEL